MVGQFGNHIKEWVVDWETGGGMYADFVALVEEQYRRRRKKREVAVEKENQVVIEIEKEKEEKYSPDSESRIKRLQAALEEMGRSFRKRGDGLVGGGGGGGVDSDELTQRVACQEMARTVAAVVAEREMVCLFFLVLLIVPLLLIPTSLHPVSLPSEC